MERPRGTVTLADRVPEGHSVSNFTVTLSTLVRPRNPEEEYALKRMLESFQRELSDSTLADRVFHFNSAADRITIVRGTPEVGQNPRGKRVHVHFSVKTTHARKYNVNEIQRNFQTALKEYAAGQGIDLAGAYARVEVDKSSYWENYILKEQYGPTARAGPSAPGYGRLLAKEVAAFKRRVGKKQ